MIESGCISCGSLIDEALCGRDGSVLLPDVFGQWASLKIPITFTSITVVVPMLIYEWVNRLGHTTQSNVMRVRFACCFASLPVGAAFPSMFLYRGVEEHKGETYAASNRFIDSYSPICYRHVRWLPSSAVVCGPDGVALQSEAVSGACR